jgi:acyl-CoA thioesterase II
MTTTGDVRPTSLQASLRAEELLPGILDLERLEVDLFRGRSPREDLQRVFGGQVAGQALVAAGRTVPADRSVHSLHAYFLRPGDPAAPIVYAVDRIRDGRSFTTRRVVATQHGKAIFTLSASFHMGEDGAEHQFAMPDVPAPDEVPLWQDRLREFGDRVPAQWLRPRPVEVCYIGDPPWVVRDPVAAGDAHTMVWMRAVGTLPNDPLLHVCAAAYASDMTLLDSVLVAQRAWAEGSATGDSAVTGASLDHAMWFHAPFRADDWLLYVQEAPVTSGARGRARGHVYRHDGRPAVSVVQEGLIRVTSGDQG